jgi:hypothetical protein
MSYKLVRSVRCFSGRICWFVALAAAAIVAANACRSRASETAPSESKGISVGRMVFCRSIKDREPQETAEKFPNDIKSVFCFTVIVNAGAETHVVHKWYHGEKLMAEVTLKAQGEYWRTWSTKRMAADQTGTWRVDVVSADGKILKSASFELVAAGAEEEQAESEDAGTDEEPTDGNAPDDEDQGDDSEGQGAGDTE